MRSVYLDNLSATPAHPQVVRAMLPYLGEVHFGNPSSPHRAGAEPRRAVEAARERIAAFLGAAPGEILFTASGSESNNLAVKGIALSRTGRHIVTSAVEHLSVLHPLRTLEAGGYRVTRLPVDRQGRVDPADLRRALRPDTALVTIGHAVAEVGTLQFVEELAEIAAASGTPFHTDAVAAAGSVSLDLRKVPVAALSLSPLQFHGPRGVGLLFVREGVLIRPQVEGGVQEGGLRAGTENVAGIVGAGVAADLAGSEREERRTRLSRLGAELRRRLLEAVPDVLPTGHPTERIPGHLSVCVRGAEGEAVLQGLDARGIAAASGSACVSGAGKDSYVLEAMGIEPELRRSSLVFSLGIFNTAEDVDALIGAFPGVVGQLRRVSSG